LHFCFYGTLPAIIIKLALNNVGFYDASHRNNRLRRLVHSMPVRLAIGFIARRNKPSASIARRCMPALLIRFHGRAAIRQGNHGSIAIMRNTPTMADFPGVIRPRPFDPDFVTSRHAGFIL
jgi:hypothetical protein